MTARTIAVVDEKIIAAAVHFGATISLPPPARHHTILHFMALQLGVDTKQVPLQAQGFLTSMGRFVNRTEAYYIAMSEGQIVKKTGTVDVPTLYSEDMW